MLIEQYFRQLKDHLKKQENIEGFKFKKDEIKTFNLHLKIFPYRIVDILDREIKDQFLVEKLK